VTAPSATAPTPGFARRAWPRIRRFGALRLVLLVVAVLAFGYLVLARNGRFAEGTAWQVPLVLELLLLSIAWRTISARTVMTFFFVGFGPIFFAMVASQVLLTASPLHGWFEDLSLGFAKSNFGSLGPIEANVWAPITEELWKIVPLLVLLRWGRSHLKAQGSPLDFALLAGATGAGMGMAEDLFQLGGIAWTVPASPLLGLGVGAAYVGLVVNPLNRGQLPVFDFDLSYQGLVGIFDPSVEELQLGAIWPGHGVLPLAFGLALGLALLWRRRYGILVYALPAVVLVWAIWDHFVANWYSFARCDRADAPTLCGLAHLDGTGAAFPLAAIALWVVGSLVTRRLVAGHRAADPAFATGRVRFSTALYRQTGATWPLSFARDVLRYWRMRTRLAIGWANLAGAPADRRGEAADALAPVRIEALALAARLRNEPLPPLPEASQQRITRALGRI
jgi:hypothetical protein